MKHESSPMISCPVCQKPSRLTDDNPSRPFCSPRCKLIDLGDWATESHRIAGEPAMDEADLENWQKMPD